MGIVKKVKKLIVNDILPRDEPFFGIKSAAVEYSIWGALLLGALGTAAYTYVRDYAETRAEKQRTLEKARTFHYHLRNVRRGDTLGGMCRIYRDPAEHYQKKIIQDITIEENGLTDPD